MLPSLPAPLRALRRGLLAGAIAVLAAAAPARAQNAIVTENQQPGTPQSTWDVSGAGDASIQGFATDISVNKGSQVRFKIKTNASAYTITIYRLGWYQGNGARQVGTGTITATLPQSQPNPTTDGSTGLVDCGNWANSARWNVPSTAVSGIYLARLRRSDTGGASHIVFVVRDDSSHSDVLVKTSDATWHAYNVFGGNSFYTGTTSYPGGRAVKVSYNRPFSTRAGGGGSGQPGQDWLMNAEYPMVRWLESNGYDVTYTTDVDADRRGSLIANHKVFATMGHDEYWSGAARASVEAARDAGVHLAFFDGNEVYWKTRFENTNRTLVCYKEGTQGELVCGGKCDPTSTWTGLWRDGCAFPSGGGCKPENALSGQISWKEADGSIVVGSQYKALRFWRNTPVASLASGNSVTMTFGTLGYEWDQQQFDASYPASRVQLSTTVLSSATHHLSLYRAPSGALVFGAGTVQWSWGLDGTHDRGSAAPSPAMQQATVNLFADMGVQPGSLRPGLVTASPSNDTTAPVATIVSPANNGSVPANSNVTISGTASDAAGVVTGVQVSVDGGATWQAATGTTNWTFAWTTPASGAVNVRARAVDDLGNLGAPGAPPSAGSITVNVGGGGGPTCPCTGFAANEAPATGPFNDGQAIETGVKFRVAQSGYVTALRFYKQPTNTGTHVGQLWSNAGAKLGEATFVNETASGWQQVTLQPAVAVQAGTTYIAAYYSLGGTYSSTANYFTSAKLSGPIRLLADGEDGLNGVYSYGSNLRPTSGFQASNYWVDLVFDTVQPVDNTPPTVLSVTPAANASGVAVGTTPTATFSEALNASTVTTSTVLLRIGANNVTGTVAYDNANRRVTFTPSAPLANSTQYTVTLRGGATGIKDVAGNALASDFVWSFTTTAPPPPPPTDGPGGPVLVVSSSANSFSRYPVEILRAEGFNLFKALDLPAVNATVLGSYDVVVIGGDVALTSTQATMFSDWVNAGGTLIAFRPDKDLAGLLGLTDAGSTLSNAYLKVNATGAGVGIESQTMQYHGTADRYTLNGATAIATLYSNASTATSNPAVTQRSVGTNGGLAIAFTFDLARSVVYTRQGNPAWAGQDRDGQAPIRSNDLFFGASASDPQPDWVDLSKVAIPQADEQQRLFANLVLQGNLHRKPLPRFWYFPKGKKAVVVMTGDDHGDAGMQPRFDIYRQQSPAGCSADDWECVRATGYEYVGTGFTDAQAQFYQGLGFEVALHVNTDCLNYTPQSLESAFSSQLGQFAAAFPSDPAPKTNRTHCIVWSDWSTHAETEVAHGIRLDTNYYWWPGTWVQNRPGVFTGSGIPMRFAKTDGSLIDCYQVPTQMTDESNQTYPMHCDSLLERALGSRGYYGAFCANMHFDNVPETASDQIVQSALARGVPVVSAEQLLTWLDGRGGSSFGSLAWSNSTLTFTLAVAGGARNLQAMLPLNATPGALTSLTLNGAPVTFTTQAIKGVTYAFFPASAGAYAARYGSGGGDVTPPVISGVTATPNANFTATVAWTTNEAATTRVDYGTTSSTLNLSQSNGSLVTSHSISLPGLAPNTTYFYRVTSADAVPNSATFPATGSSPLSFTTPPNTAPVAAAAASPTSGSAPLTVNFSGAASTDANGDSLTFAWAFGDGGTATGRLASHAYAAAGAYAALLTVTDGRGGQDTASVAIAVTTGSSGFPTTAVLDDFNRADGAPADGTHPWVAVQGTMAIAANTLRGTTSSPAPEYLWNTSFAADQEAYVTLGGTFPSSGFAEVIFKAQGTTSASQRADCYYDFAAKSVTVETWNGTSWTTRGTQAVTFAPGDRLGVRARANGSVEVYRNATLVTTVSITGWTPFASAGRIGVGASNGTQRLDDFGGGAFSTADVTPPAISGVTATPNANFTATVAWTTNEAATTRVDYGTTSSTLGQTQSNGSLVTSHSIVLPGLAPNTTYFYRVTSADAVPNSATFPATGSSPLSFTTPPNTAPVAAAAGSPTSGSAPLTVNFSGAASTDANGDSLTFAWTFGDGGTATGRLSSHTYANPGGYAAILTVTDGRGGQDTASVAISASSTPNTPPVARATGTPTSGQAPLAVNFSGATSTDANNDSLTFAWTFGDGGTATGRLASHTFTTAGAFAVVLTVTDGKGGQDTASVAISVTSPPVGFPGTPVLDNFNRANGAPADGTHPWLAVQGTMAINANVLQATTTGPEYVWGTSQPADQEVYVTLAGTFPASGFAEVIFKAQGTTASSQRADCYYDFAAKQVVVETYNGTSWTTRGTQAVTFVAGDRLGVRARANGTVEVYRNATLVRSVSITAWTPFASAGRIGVGASNSTQRLDDFGGGPIPSGALLAADAFPLRAEAAPGRPRTVELSNAFPNPTRSGAAFVLALPEESRVGVSVLDLQGREVWRAPDATYAAGRWTLTWNGTAAGAPARPGVYLVRVRAGGTETLKRVAVVR